MVGANSIKNLGFTAAEVPTSVHSSMFLFSTIFRRRESQSRTG